ncbi:glutathione S-transferase family protein [Vibrio sp.]|uniref:Glutathione S-transferase family protein n=1 Tax=Vibrio viridaestus TaxID=2487322 RepID=A0A3N9TF15_9VIBR|nr:glutathione S-transferase family protein [Vibrio viridaestus]MDC0611407.1 glutathione S-transferase family protein [Vibrio sp.]RQW62719.1 glutathione S-transferase family protein [Vibrio viridaestus]
MELYIGNKNYSTWSLRAWMVMRFFNLDFKEKPLSLDTPQFYEELKLVCPSMKVPCLVDDDLTVWDSLAICEYINDKYLSGKAWPGDLARRAQARAIAAEMHSGFMALRAAMPMNIRAERRVDVSESVRKDILRIEDIFAERMRTNNQEINDGWLFGDFSIADAMFIPVVLRFKTYRVILEDDAQKYVDFVLNSPVLAEWVEHALSETDIVEADEAGEPIF